MRLYILLGILFLTGCSSTHHSSDEASGVFQQFSDSYWSKVESGKINEIAIFSPILYSMAEKDREWYIANFLSRSDLNDKGKIASVVNRKLYCSFTHGGFELYMEDVEFSGEGKSFVNRYIYVFDSKYWYVGLANKSTLGHFSKWSPMANKPKQKLTPPACVKELMV